MDLPPELGYVHEQNAAQWVAVAVSLFAIVMFSLAAGMARSDDVPAWSALLVTLSMGLLFLAVIDATRLTTTVTPSAVTLRFRLGWPSKTIDRSRIVAARRRHNSPLFGWGIRKIPGGWMWNVCGLESVELDLDSGSLFRIGTDDPDGLLAAING